MGDTLRDEATFNQDLNDLHVCYTVTRGLQLHRDKPNRRPALPLEIILRILRHAGFVDPKPDLALTSEAAMFGIYKRESGRYSVCYTADPLTQTQLASMARMRLVSLIGNPIAQVIPYGLTPAFWAFTPLGTEDRHGGSKTLVASLYACADENEARIMHERTPGTTVGSSFGPEHEISRQLDGGSCPLVTVISQQPARLLIWKWWEPRF